MHLLSTSLVLLHLLLLSSSIASSSSWQAQDYVKLPLFQSTPAPTAGQALAFDTVRLSFLAASSSSSTAPPPPPTALSAPVVSGASSGSGQYFVDLHLGTPPQRLRLVADTGSDLVWARCSACRSGDDDCLLHHPPSTAFLPRRSSSFRPFHCFQSACRLVPHPPATLTPPCVHRSLHSPCRYRYSYADRSSSAGVFSREIANINSTTSAGSGHHRRSQLVRLHSIPFGCAFNVSSGSASSLPAFSGVLGLGRGVISFPSHAARSFGDAFSYCLIDYTRAPPPISFLLIGAAAHSTLLTGPRRGGVSRNLSYTPLLHNPLSPTFYYVRVLAVSVDGSQLAVDPDVWALDPATGAGGTVVDSGTTLTFVPALAYRAILRAVAARLPAAGVVEAPPAGFDLCVNATAKMRIPRLRFRLLGGAELAPPARNYFIEAAEGWRCLAVQPVSQTEAGFAVIGNLMQQGFLMVFDRAASRLGFSRTGCGA